MQLTQNHTLHNLSGRMEHQYLDKSFQLYKSKANVSVTDNDLKMCSLASGKIMRAARPNQLGDESNLQMHRQGRYALFAGPSGQDNMLLQTLAARTTKTTPD